MKKLALLLTFSFMTVPVLADNAVQESIEIKKKVLIGTGVVSGLAASIFIFNVCRNGTKVYSIRQMQSVDSSLPDAHDSDLLEIPTDNVKESAVKINNTGVFSAHYDALIRPHTAKLIGYAIASVVALGGMITSAALYKKLKDKLKTSNKIQ